MKKLACWSHQNPWKARMIIAISHVAIWSLAIWAGTQLFMEDMVVSQTSITCMAVAFALAYIGYPVRKAKDGFFRYSFSRRIRHDVVLLATSAWIITGSVNQFAFRPMDIPSKNIPVILMVANEVHGMRGKAAKLGMKEWTNKLKEFRKSWKQKLKEQKDTNPEKSTGTKVALILLTLLGAFAAFVGVASAACSLSCAGNEGLASIVGFGGTIGIIILTVIVISAIVKKKNFETPAATII